MRRAASYTAGDGSERCRWSGPAWLQPGSQASLRTLPLLAAVLAIWPGPVEAHDIYTHLKSRSGQSCCDGTDCRPVPYWVTASGVEMRVGETRIVVPRETVQHRALDGDTGETNGGHWYGERYESSFITYCAFLPPNLASALPWP